MEKTINGQQKLRLCIGYAQNPANTHPCSLDEFLSIGTSQHVADICLKLSQTSPCRVCASSSSVRVASTC